MSTFSVFLVETNHSWAAVSQTSVTGNVILFKLSCRTAGAWLTVKARQRFDNDTELACCFIGMLFVIVVGQEWATQCHHLKLYLGWMRVNGKFGCLGKVRKVIQLS